VVPVAPTVITKALSLMPQGTDIIRDWKRDYLED
jgi:membrane protein required for colicin V production